MLHLLLEHPDHDLLIGKKTRDMEFHATVQIEADMTLVND